MSVTTLLTSLKLASSLAGQPDTTTVQDTIQHKEEPKTEQIYTQSNVEVHKTTEAKSDKARLNLYYDLPLNTSTYMFVELYPNGYFAKTMLHTPINKAGTGLKTELKNSNLFKDHVNIGLEQKFALYGINGCVKVLPLSLGMEGYRRNTVVAGGYIGKSWDIPIGKKEFQIDISAFAEANIAAKGGPQWGYGEAEAAVHIPTKAGKFDLGLGYNLNGKGKALPDPQFRLKIGYHPKR